jgi:hypothetical protein
MYGAAVEVLEVIGIAIVSTGARVAAAAVVGGVIAAALIVPAFLHYAIWSRDDAIIDLSKSIWKSLSAKESP